MADLRPQFSEEVVGHGHPTKTDVTNRAWNVEHAEDGTHKVLPGASGIKMWFYQNVAPTGWTLDATPSDDLLAVKGGAQAYNAGGGTGAGTWTVAGLTKDAHTHNFTHPSAHGNHDHGVGTFKFKTGEGHATLQFFLMYNAAGAAVAINGIVTRGTGASDVPYFIPGSGQFYTKDGSGSTQSIALTNNHSGGSVNAQSNATISSTGTWRPKARLGIICTKD